MLPNSEAKLSLMRLRYIEIAKDLPYDFCSLVGDTITEALPTYEWLMDVDGV
jgi:hypothetical protein